MMSTKMAATLGLLKVNFFYDVTSKNLSTDSNYIVDVVMWPKFGNSSISMGEVIITSTLYGFDQKKHFFWRVVFDQVQ